MLQIQNYDISPVKIIDSESNFKLQENYDH